MSDQINTTSIVSKLANSGRAARLLLLLDLFMVSLILINISWLLFDSAFAIDELRAIIQLFLGERFDSWYAAQMHPNFYRFDLIFIAIFATELLGRWGWAVYKKQYRRWYAYPILHWYDVLGCIPVGELRLLRLLRLLAIAVRLQQQGIIDVRHWWLTTQLRWLLSIIIEEISDRVVVRVLTGVQDELKSDSTIEQKLVDQVFRPRQANLVGALGLQFAETAEYSYRENRNEIQAYLKQHVSAAVKANREIRVIDSLPFVGGVATGLLDHAINDIVCGALERSLTNLDSKQFQQLFDSIATTAIDHALAGEVDPDNELTDAIVDGIDVIKSQVKQRRWLQQ